jgi:DNA-binding FrmR family transcriptional regulator
MDAQTQREVSRRLRSVEGHLRGVLRMVETDQPCMAILHQVQALQGSLKQINALLLDSHLEHCLRYVNSAESEDSRQQLRTELVTLFNRKGAGG